MTAAYVGLRTIQIKTFTTTYAPLVTPWNWCGFAMQPMEFASTYNNAGDASIRGIGGNVFDDATGLTKYSIGDLTSFPFGGAATCLWYNKKLQGWSYGPANAPVQAIFSFPLSLGTPTNIAAFSTAGGIMTPNGSPNVYASAGFLCADGTIYGSFNNGPLPAVNQAVGFFDTATLAAHFTNTPAFLYGSSVLYGGSIPYNGTNWVVTGYQGGGGTKYVMSTDFVTFDTIQIMGLVNPPGSSLDLNALVISQLQPGIAPTYDGWLYINSSTLTIGTQTLNGFGILIQPDFSSYVVFQIVPTDGASANWTAANGYAARFDQSGVMWMKDGGNNTTIFKSLPVARDILQVYAPVPLPSPPADGEIMLKAYEGYGL